MNKNEKFVVTISRQLGSGGAYVGQQLAKRLGVFYADREIISKAAEHLSVKESTVEEREETIPSFWRSFLNSATVYPELYVQPIMLVPTEYDFFLAESEVIKRTADERSAGIMGRCGFHILRKNPNRVSIFLHASREFRVKRYAELYQATQEDAEKTLTRCDKERAHYCRNFTGCDHADAQNYDLSIDTSRLETLDKAVDVIMAYLQARIQLS